MSGKHVNLSVTKHALKRWNDRIGRGEYREIENSFRWASPASRRLQRMAMNYAQANTFIFSGKDVHRPEDISFFVNYDDGAIFLAREKTPGTLTIISVYNIAHLRSFDRKWGKG